jgi:hypothetical protein
LSPEAGVSPDAVARVFGFMVFGLFVKTFLWMGLGFSDQDWISRSAEKTLRCSSKPPPDLLQILELTIWLIGHIVIPGLRVTIIKAIAAAASALGHCWVRITFGFIWSQIGV